MMLGRSISRFRGTRINFISTLPQLQNHLQYIRYFSQNNNDSKKNSFLEDIKPNLKNGIFIGGGTIAFYGISRFIYDITLSFMSLTPAASLYYGFIGGIISTAITAGGIVAVHNHRYVSPDSLVRQAISKVKNHEELTILLGKNLKFTEIRTFRRNSQQSDQSWSNFSSMFLSLSPPQVEVMLGVKGEKGSGIVTCLGKKSRWGNHEILYLAVDLLSSSSASSVVHIEGDPSLSYTLSLTPFSPPSSELESFIDLLNQRRNQPKGNN